MFGVSQVLQGLDRMSLPFPAQVLGGAEVSGKDPARLASEAAL